MLHALNLVNFSSWLLKVSVTYRETSHICGLYKLRRSSEHHLLFPGLTQEVVRSHIPNTKKVAFADWVPAMYFEVQFELSLWILKLERYYFQRLALKSVSHNISILPHGLTFFWNDCILLICCLEKLDHSNRHAH